MLPIYDQYSFKACDNTSPLCREFRTLQLTENMRLTAARNNFKSNTNTLYFSSYLFVIRERRPHVTKRNESRSLFQSHLILMPIISVKPIFISIETNYMLEDWLTRRAVLTTKMDTLNKSALISDFIPCERKMFMSSNRKQKRERA